MNTIQKTACALLAGVSLALNGCDDSSSSNDPNWPPMTGEKYALGQGALKVPCADDLDAMNSALDAAGKNDDVGYREALMMHGVQLEPGTHILVLNFDVLKNIVDMRVRSGDHDGERVYCAVGSDNEGFISRHL